LARRKARGVDASRPGPAASVPPRPGDPGQQLCRAPTRRKLRRRKRGNEGDPRPTAKTGPKPFDSPQFHSTDICCLDNPNRSCRVGKASARTLNTINTFVRRPTIRINAKSAVAGWYGAREACSATVPCQRLEPYGLNAPLIRLDMMVAGSTCADGPASDTVSISVEVPHA